MDTLEACPRRIQIGLGLRAPERARLEQYALARGAPTLAAAIRLALPEVFFEPAREGHQQGVPQNRKVVP